jgi:hypothetical protein
LYQRGQLGAVRDGDPVFGAGEPALQVAPLFEVAAAVGFVGQLGEYQRGLCAGVVGVQRQDAGFVLGVDAGLGGGEHQVGWAVLGDLLRGEMPVLVADGDLVLDAALGQQRPDEIAGHVVFDALTQCGDLVNDQCAVGEFLVGVDQRVLGHAGELQVGLRWKEPGHRLDGVRLAGCRMPFDAGGNLLVQQPRGQDQVEQFGQPLLTHQAAAFDLFGEVVEDAPHTRTVRHSG